MVLHVRSSCDDRLCAVVMGVAVLEMTLDVV